MKVLEDGSFRVDKGERFPFICPKCMFPVAFQDNIAQIKCSRCKHIGLTDEFSKMGMAFLDKRPKYTPKLSLPLRIALMLKWFYLDKTTNKFGLWLRLIFYPIMNPLIRLALWATRPSK